MEEIYTQEILKNKQNRYEHITKRERDIISKHLSAGKRISYIALRPEVVNKRERFGDFEVDTVISARGGKSCIAVAVERKFRYYILRKIPDKSATSMNNALIDMLKNTTVKTITYDNGSENMKHEELNKLLGCQSYFCRPYCSADKGSIENRNKILRQFLPQKTNFDLISQHQIDIIQNKINNRPMKVLN